MRTRPVRPVSFPSPFAFGSPKNSGTTTCSSASSASPSLVTPIPHGFCGLSIVPVTVMAAVSMRETRPSANSATNRCAPVGERAGARAAGGAALLGRAAGRTVARLAVAGVDDPVPARRGSGVEVDWRRLRRLERAVHHGAAHGDERAQPHLPLHAGAPTLAEDDLAPRPLPGRAQLRLARRAQRPDGERPVLEHYDLTARPEQPCSLHG